MIKILIVDDSPPFRESLKAFLTAHPEVDVVGETGDGLTALRKARELKPDVVLMDINMEGMNGFNATERLKEKLPDIKVIILSMYDLEQYREAAEAKGASAYVTKRALVGELLPAIQRAVQAGKSTHRRTSSRRRSSS
jgi:DNA-binding NarL/FixJ family response regulator